MPVGRLHVHQRVDAFGDLLNVVDAERQGHAAFAAELVDEDLVAGMALDVFKQQRRAAGRVLAGARLFRSRMGAGLHSNLGNAVGDLGDFELRRNFFADALQLAVLFESLNPVAQIVVGQVSAPCLLSEPYLA